MTFFVDPVSDPVKAAVEGISAIDLLEGLGARNIQNPDGPWIRHSCLIDTVDPHHSNGDESPSAAMDTDTKRYSCFSYGVISCSHLLDLLFRSDDAAIFAFLHDLPKMEDKSFEDQLSDLFHEEAKPVNQPLSELVLDSYSKDWTYMTEERGVSEAVCERFKLRYHDGKVVIPLYERKPTGQQILVGFQRREVEGPGPKYVNQKDLVKDNLLYYGSEAYDSESVIVVESIMSVLRLETIGITNSVCTLGSKVLPSQASLLARHREVTIWFDDDLSGVSGAYWLASQLADKTLVSVIISDMRHYDPADMTEDQVRRNLASAVPAFKGIPGLAKLKAVLGGEARGTRPLAVAS